ncbi:hypothetical protein YTPLAS73_00010 [Nitrosarchaeum sp.]|nr:hypothetical protein YTPLAS73_00010 [Nitrosarchaeum sp.]
MIESLHLEHEELSVFQILQFDEMATIIKQVVMESKENPICKITKNDKSYPNILEQKIKQRKLNFLFNPENF